ncbi:MAG: alanine--tRNA ligase [Clostridia bacterium]|nr:alanine--tRNA ligase [Clostridia bacterium]
MERLGLNEIRERYLSFFESKGHLRLPSFPLVPQNDDSLLLINAGMAPLKPYFVGKEIPPRNRVTTCQKCIRTPDIERVGKTARHGTFFEMLGNFSFGDYFKHEATAWAWEFITEDLKLPKDKLWVTVYEDDDEAIDIWVNEVGVERDRIKKMGKEDNFWEIGTGPCGPCSEIYFDRGVENGCGKPDCAVGCDCDRFVEFWNLVFTQFDKDEDGNYNRLAKPNIDTGMGLERIAAIMQGVQNLFEVDTVRNIMLEISKIAGVNYGENEKSDVSLRVITDHIRSTTFLVCDGVGPSNEGRGYVLRRLLRRAARHGRLLGIKGNFLYNIADTVINESKNAYPQLEAKRDYIKKVIQIEEARFSETIDAGLNILEDYIAALEEKGEKLLAGADAFRLYDTYGFPIDLTAEILTEKGLDVDMDAFTACMNEQKNRSREGRNVGEEAAWSEDVYMQIGKEVTSEFIGYENESAEGKVLAIVKDNAIAASLSDGENGVVILDKTAIYGESGGQKGDMGVIIADGVKMVVTDAKKLGDGKILNFVYVEEGSVSVGDSVTSSYDKVRRMDTARNHSATHLLQKALQEVVGSHIEQAGSFVDDKRLRFDFTHFEAISADDLKKVENKVNEAIMASYDIDVKVMPIEEAKKMGAMALFGEKYGETVRVVNMGGYSIEFCGGTHLKNTAQAGLFKILSEGGVAAGVRRIEATTGRGVLEYIAEKDSVIAQAAEVLKTNPSELVNKAESVTGELKAIQKSLEEVKAKMAQAAANDLLTSIKHVGDVDVLTAQLSGVSADELKMLTDKMKEKCECGVAVLASVDADKITFVAAATKAAVAKGAHAGNIIKEITKVTDGRGGGKPDMAQGGGKLVNKVDDALAMVDDLIIAQTGGNK